MNAIPSQVPKLLTQADFLAIAQRQLEQGNNDPLTIVHDQAGAQHLEPVSWNGHKVAIAESNPQRLSYHVIVNTFQNSLGIHSHFFEPFREEALTKGLTPSMIQNVSNLINESMPTASPISDDDLTLTLSASISSTSLDAQKAPSVVTSEGSPQEAIPINDAHAIYDIDPRTDELYVRCDSYDGELKFIPQMVRADPNNELHFYEQKETEARIGGSIEESNAFKKAALHTKAEIDSRALAAEKTGQPLESVLGGLAHFSYQQATYLSNKAQALHDGKTAEAEAWSQVAEAAQEMEECLLKFLQSRLAQENSSELSKKTSWHHAMKAGQEVMSLHLLAAEAFRDDDTSQAALLTKFATDAKKIFESRKNAALATRPTAIESWNRKAEKDEVTLHSSLEAAQIFLPQSF